jgi:hypothetical protein
MVMNVRIRNAETGGTVDMEMEEDNTVQEIIESATSYWKKDEGAYVLRKGKKMLRGQQTVAEVGINDEDELELIPDPEGGA